MRTKTDAGKMYGIGLDGRMIEVDRDAHVPDKVICRRVADYAPAKPPAGAGFTTCATCGARIAFNPRGPHQDKPKVCMQCAGVEPLPIES